MNRTIKQLEKIEYSLSRVLPKRTYSPRVYTVSEVAGMLDLPVHWVAQWARITKQNQPGGKHGHYRIPREEVERLRAFLRR